MKLHVLTGADVGGVLEPNPAGFTVGRGKDNDHEVPEEGTSRHHCRIEKKPEGWVVEDLGSVNGVRVNGRRIQDRESLRDGDVIDICGHEMRVDLPGSALPPAVVPQRDVPPAVVPQRNEQTIPESMPDQAREALPWGRISLLAGMCMLIAALAFLLHTGPKPEGTGEQAKKDGEPSAKAAEAPAGNLAPDALSDQELEKLLDDQEKLDAAKGVATPLPDPPVGAGGKADTTTPPTAADTPAPGATDMLLVQSKPAGATVFIDEVEKGTTPAVITGLAEGRHRVMLKLPGYQDLPRLIYVPDVPAPAPYVLRQRPNTLYVTSDPAGVSVARGSQWLGVTPVLLRDLPTGEITLTLAMADCPRRREKVTISAVRGEQLQIEMKPELGDLTIETQPPGCQVLVDGLLMGTTRGEAAGPGAKGTLRVPNLLVGERSVQVEHPCGAMTGRKLQVTAGGNAELAIRLWVPDTRVVLLNDDVRNGMLIERNEQGDIELALSPRPKDRASYLKPRIREERALSEAEAQETFLKVVQPGGAAAAKPAGKPGTGVDARWGDEADGKDPLGDAAGEPARDDDPAPARKRVIEVTELELTEALAKDTKFGFLRQNHGRMFEVTGRPSSIRRDGLSGVVLFGRRIRCELSKKEYTEERKKMASLAESGRRLTIRGKAKGFDGDRLILSGCKPIYPAEEDN
ncbi:MAG: PEGA domain-containing protein [Victivallales bacterium]|nr:PEGA domain-containing protein [Victivallales bacterium]